MTKSNCEKLRPLNITLYVENQGLRNQGGESLEQAYVRVEVGNDWKDITIEEYMEHEGLWDLVEFAGFDCDIIDENQMEIDPFISTYVGNLI